MDRMYDERYGDIHFDEEDPQSELYNPKCCRNVYLDLIRGVFDEAFENYNDDIQPDLHQKEDEVKDEDIEYDEEYYEADGEYDDY